MKKRYIIPIGALLYPLLLFLFMSLSFFIMFQLLLSVIFSFIAYITVFIMRNDKAKRLWIPLSVNYVSSFSYIAFLIWDMFFGMAASCGYDYQLNAYNLPPYMSLVSSGIITIFAYSGLPLSIYTLSLLNNNLNKIKKIFSLVRVILFFIILTITGAMLQ